MTTGTGMSIQGERAVASTAKRGREMTFGPLPRHQDVIRELENTAIAQLDALLARELGDVDRTYNRTMAVIDSELERRQEASPHIPRRRHPATLDVAAWLTSTVGASLLLAGGGGVGSVPTHAALISATVLGAVAVGMHAASVLRASRSGYATSGANMFAVFGAVMLFAAAALGYWRSTLDDEADPILALVCSGTLAVGALLTTALIAAGAEDRAEVRREIAAERDYAATIRIDLAIRVEELVSTSSASARRILGELDDASGAALETAIAAGITALERRGVLETAVIARMREVRRGDLRYEAGL